MAIQISDIESTIDTIVNSEFGQRHNVVVKLSEIKEIPISHFSELQSALASGNAVMRQFPLSTCGSTLSIIASPSEKRIIDIMSMSTFVVPIIGIICAFIFSWWFLLFIIYPLISIAIGKRIYLKVLFDRATNSEKAFCFLFCGRLITLELPGVGIISRQDL